MRFQTFLREQTGVNESGEKSLPLGRGGEQLHGGANDNYSATSHAKARRQPKALGGLAKRLTDIVLASTAIILALPVMVLVSLILKMSGNSVLFVHSRIGLNGRSFDCYKFKTMVSDPETVLENHLAQNPDAAAEWRDTQKLKKDPRITFLGQILRSSSIDELPQLFNILRGDMSCVGPRPITAHEISRYGKDIGKYLACRPGLTGLWQVSGRNSLTYDRRVELDCRYVDKWSLGADFVILFRTIFAILRFHETS